MPFTVFTMTDFTYSINFSIILKYFETPFWEEPSRLVYKPLEKSSFVIFYHITYRIHS